MAAQTVCPRCGARDSFIKGYLPETCVCRICQSQLDWREIPGCGPDCSAAKTPSDPSEGNAEDNTKAGAGAPGDEAPGDGRWDV